MSGDGAGSSLTDFSPRRKGEKEKRGILGARMLGLHCPSLRSSMVRLLIKRKEKIKRKANRTEI